MTGEDNTLMMQNPVIPNFEGEEASEISTDAPFHNPYSTPAYVDDKRAYQIAYDLFKGQSNGPSDIFQPQSQIFETQQNFDMIDKRSTQNMTRCVKVPSSEHVAEIVGRQGSKIKALRAKSNTYIKTPMRGEEPIFVVTGRQEDVAKAAQDILSAAEHFTQIRACRKNQPNGGFAPGPASNPPGSITRKVTVPYRVVGLVVGPKGATIKRIQQNTQTYIVTPSREKDPIFEVTGMPPNVIAAEQEIMNHITHRTGNQEEYSTFLSVLASHGLSVENLTQAEFANIFQTWSQTCSPSVGHSQITSSSACKQSSTAYSGISQASIGSSMQAGGNSVMLSGSRNVSQSSFGSSMNMGGVNMYNSTQNSFGTSANSSLSSTNGSMCANSQNLLDTATKNAFNSAMTSSLASSLMNGSAGPFSDRSASTLQQAFTSNGLPSLANSGSSLLSGLSSNTSRAPQLPDLKSDLSTAQTVASVLSSLPVGQSTYSSASMADKFKSAGIGNLNYLNDFDYSMLSMPATSSVLTDPFDMSCFRKDQKNVDEGIDSLGSSRAGSSTGSPSLDKTSTSPIMSTFPMKRSPLSSSDGSLTSGGGSPPPSWSVGSNLKPDNLEALSIAFSKNKVSEIGMPGSLDSSSIAVAAAEKVLSSQVSPSSDSSRRSSDTEVAV